MDARLGTHGTLGVESRKEDCIVAGEQKGRQEQVLADFQQYKKDMQKSYLLRLEARAVKFLWSFIERDASTWRFWAKIMGVMLIANTVLPAAIYLYFLGRDLGYFE